MFRLILALALGVCACQKPFEKRLEQGDAEARAGRWESARARWAEATQEDPQSSVAYSKLGLALWNLGLKDEAGAAWTIAVKLDPLLEDAIEGLARVDLHQLDAGAAAARLLEVPSPSRMSFRIALAQALLARGEPGDAATALATAQAAAANARGDAEVEYLVGSALIALRRFGEAQATMEGVSRHHPESQLGSYGLARIAAAQNRQTDALLHLSAAQSAAGSHWKPEQVAADPAFAFLVDSPEFKALVSK